MPSASAKLEKQASFEASDCSKQILNVLEKKVRNLEKRKSKLDTLKADFQQGKELNADQKNAITRYDEVLQTLDIAKELQKNITTIVQETAKAHKKQVKREQVEKQGLEMQRLRELLIIQDVLNNMGMEHVRSSFLTGLNGAPVLTEDNLNQLDDVYKLISPSRELEDGDPSHEEQLTQASEHLLALLDAKNKEVLGTTYKDLKDLIMKIHDCGFLSSSFVVQSGTVNGDEETEEPVEQETKTEYVDEPEEEYSEIEQNVTPTEILTTCPPVETIPTTPIDSEEVAVSQQRVAVHQGTGHPAETLFAAAPYTHARTLSSEFNFLQESQIDMDSPHMDPAVVIAHPMPSAPSLAFSAQAADSISGFHSQHSLEDPSQQGSSSTLPSAQFTQGNSSSAAPPPASLLPLALGQAEFNQPIPTQTFTNHKFVAIQNLGTTPPTFAGQNMYSPMDQGMASQMTQPVAGSLSPPVTDVSGGPSAMNLGGQIATTVEPKKHYMNANAAAFEAISFKQPSSTMTSSPPPDQSGNATTLTTSQTTHFIPSQTSPKQPVHPSPTSEISSGDAGSWHSKNQTPGSYPHPMGQQASGFQARTGGGGGFNGRGNRGGRGNRFNNSGGRGGGNFGGGRGVNNNNYQYRENQGAYFQNNYSRENYSGGSGQNNYSNGGYKRTTGANSAGAKSSGNRGNLARGSNMRGGRVGYNKGNPSQ